VRQINAPGNTGIYCTVELQIPRTTPSYQASGDAIIFNEVGSQVALVENDVVHLRNVAVVRDLARAGGRSQQRRQAGRPRDPDPAVDLTKDSSRVRTPPELAQTS
jgi:hypothetical protein